jgi:hypothetical protein
MLVHLARGRPTSGVVEMLETQLSDAIGSLKGGQPTAREALKKVALVVAATSK